MEPVQIIRSRLNLHPLVISDERTLFELINGSNDPVKTAKGILYLTKNKGSFIKKCPGTYNYICCGYKILHVGTFCTMDCSYCILQTYYHPPVLRHFVNYPDMLAQLHEEFRQGKTRRIGTGEFTDSLIWEKCTDLGSLLVPIFSRQDRAVLELKTKTIEIERLKKYDHNCKTIISWSINTPSVIKQEERSTASLLSRLKAASKCQSWGYPLAFHFDPMVIYPGYEEEYRETIHQLFSHISSSNIVWISLGTFRFMPSLKTIIQKRFSNSKIIYGEFITGMDGKMRYFKPLRIDLYRKIVSWIREAAPDVTIYFCMEDDEVWKKSFGFIPSEKGGLSGMLDESAITHCGLNRF